MRKGNARNRRTARRTLTRTRHLAHPRSRSDHSLTRILARTVTAIALTAISCDASQPAREVVVYTALDRSFSEPIFELFSAETGIRVRPLYDAESTKTLGLFQRIRAERERPVCDVFWNNEILHTIRLEREGLLQPWAAREREHYPEAFRDEDAHWHGFAARTRVLLVNTDLVAEDRMPTSIDALGDPAWRGRTAIAKPLFGTTATHIAALVARDGVEATAARLDRWKKNDVQVHGGNKGCARAVARGDAAIGLTDTDDAIIEVEAGHAVRIVLPDQGEDEEGALFLPNTLAIIRGAPNTEEARRLIDFLLSRAVEEKLARSSSAQIPLRDDVELEPRVPSWRDSKRFEIDLDAAADSFEEARRLVEERFLD